MIAIVVLVLLTVLGVIIYQKSQAKPLPAKAPDTQPVSGIKKVDLASQPEWVQKLAVSATRGLSPNGLQNFTVNLTGLPKDLVQSLSYVIEYQTTNKGTQGAFSSKPVDINGQIEYKSKVIDLGTCSQTTGKLNCVRHEGVTSLDIELDFTTSSGDQPVWTGTIPLK